MDDDLLATVLARLDDTKPSPGVERYLLAALEGDDALAAVLDRPDPGPGAGRPAPSPSPSAARAYLSSVKVTGFRGIGPTSILELAAGPGLTVVCGRNGSGKSSFAEALEVLLTGRLRRFEERPAIWREGWRCLHAATVEVSAELVVEGRAGPVRVCRSWDDGAGLDAGRPVGLDQLGWEADLVAYRPFLSHSELESMLGAPKALHDQLNDLLGLHDLTAAAKRLGAARLAAEKVARAARDALPALRARLETVEDERGGTAVAALGKWPDLDAVERLAAGAVPEGAAALAALRTVEQIHAPDPVDLQAAIDALDDTARRLDALAGTRSAEDGAMAALLEAALAPLPAARPRRLPGVRLPRASR